MPGFECQKTEVIDPDTLYETSLVSHLIKPAAFQAGGGARMKLHIIGTANRRISNKKFRMMKYGIAALCLFSKIIMIEYLTSIFVIPCSIFDIRFFRVSFSI